MFSSKLFFMAITRRERCPYCGFRSRAPSRSPSRRSRGRTRRRCRCLPNMSKWYSAGGRIFRPHLQLQSGRSCLRNGTGNNKRLDELRT